MKEDFAQWLQGMRRHFHAHPELSGQEFATSEYIKEVLQGLGVEVRDYPGPTGVVGLIRGAEPGPTLALRADIDALPMQELNEVPYRSQNKGVMHACGHDGHTAILLGVARAICQEGRLDKFQGNIKLLFQPSEETGTGAAQMVAHGVLEDPTVDKILACHLTPDAPVATVRVFRSLGYASNDRFKVTVQGKGCHGARPEEGRDPIVGAAYLVSALQTIVSRNIKPTEAGLISVGRLQAGGSYNVIPEEAQVEGTIRALTPQVRDLLVTRLQEICSALQSLFRLDCRLEMLEHIPACINDQGVASLLYQAAEKVLGPEAVAWAPPIMGSEDFSFFAQARPAALYRLGAAAPQKDTIAGLHNPRFDFDERALLVGVEVFLQALGDALGSTRAVAVGATA